MKKIGIPIMLIILLSVLSSIFFNAVVPWQREFVSYEFLYSRFIKNLFFIYLPLFFLIPLLVFKLSRSLKFDKRELSYAYTVGPLLVFILTITEYLMLEFFRWIATLRIYPPDILFYLSYFLVIIIVGFILTKCFYRERWKSSIIFGIVIGLATFIIHLGLEAFNYFILPGFSG